MSNPGGFHDLHICSVFVRVAVMMYVRGLLSRRNIEGLVHERGISITHEKTRFCWTRFGAIVAFEIGRLVVPTMWRVRHRRWYLYKVFVKINGVKLNLWRAGAQEDEVHADPALPAELSPVSMFLQADIVVKGVMVGLAFASAIAWTVLIAKKIEIARATRRLASSLARMGEANHIDQARGALATKDRVTGALLDAARDEATRAGGNGVRDGVKERMSIRFSRIEAAATREISFGVSLLATIGATAPFVGLFGTVWGIMNSFIGISKAQTTNLAVVAPGIAEALLATAIGLVAAIPAVIFYNHLTRSVAGYRARLGDAVATVSVIAGRELDRVPPLRVAAE